MNIKEFKDYLKKKVHAVHSAGREFILTEDRLRELGKNSPIPTRLKALKEMGEIVMKHKLENNAIEKLWFAVEDLFSKENVTEVRHAAFFFLQCIIKGQIDKLDIMRALYFRFIKYHDHPEDVGQRLELLILLTDDGKYIKHFDEEVGSFLLNWLPDINKAGKLLKYLRMIDNVIKFNAAYLDDEVMGGFIQQICVLCCSSNNIETVHACLDIMKTMVAYSNMPPDSLPKFIGALCRTVVMKDYCSTSWNVMNMLLGTDMGYGTLSTMLKILQEPALRAEVALLRGAVFFIYMALWKSGTMKFHCPPSAILPSFLQAVKSNNPSVSYEIVMGIKELVSKQHDLHTNNQTRFYRTDNQETIKLSLLLYDVSWSMIFHILSEIVRQIGNSKANQNQNFIEYLIKPLHETLNHIEDLISNDCFNGSLKDFYQIIEECHANRPESSVLSLISYLSRTIVPTEHMWLTNLNTLITKFFKPDIRTNVRLKVLEVLSNVIELNRQLYEDEIIDGIIIPHMINITVDHDVIIRAAVARLLVDLCMHCESKKCLDMLEILEKLIRRPFEKYQSGIVSATETDDVKCLVAGLINVFTVKIHKLPSSHAIKIYHMLVNLIEMHYEKPKVCENNKQIRFMIFDYFLNMRADSLYHLGSLMPDNKFKFSPYLCITYKSSDRGGPLGSPPPQSPAILSHQTPCCITYVSLRRAFKMFVTCLRQERDWEVLNMVLHKMTLVLQNKSLILSKQGNPDLDLLVDSLCGMLMDRSLNLPDSLNIKVTKQDFHAAVLLVLVGLASYHSCIDQAHQQKMIRCIQTSPRWTKQCISALTICTLEMREVMVKMLPEVLLNLSKISATVVIAIPVLEFLSTLTQLPMVFTNFVADQYMAVFAISLPYTNPFRYNHYTVYLAHHVIAVWFLKCRLPFRKDFVKFITNALRNNVLTPMEESHILKIDLANLNQDSSDRKRSSSLTEQSNRRRSASMSVRIENKPLTYLQQQQRPQPTDKNAAVFYEELTETCIDLMARYAFSPCSALPRRLPTAEFLLNGGQSMSWLVGNKLVTVTTSGCSQKVLKNGLCDKCWTLCGIQNEKLSKASTRKGSNENDVLSNTTSRQNSNDKSNNNTSASSPIEENKKMEKLDSSSVNNKLQLLAAPEGSLIERQCACWCQGWAEVYIRRPTGDMSWVMRIQNEISYQHSMYEFPLNEISTLFMPSLDLNATSEENYLESNVSNPESPRKSPSRQNSNESVEEGEEIEYIYDDGTKSRNPVRRSNSSPEMSGNWKNPFLKMGSSSNSSDSAEDKTSSSNSSDEKKNKIYPKDMRVSCEAIPEEMAGTTPPSNDSITDRHPQLLSCNSYPGSSPPKEPVNRKPYQTVPASPNILSNNQPEFTRSMSLRAYKSGSTESMDRGGLNFVPLAGKPPQSPTQTSPRMSRLNLGHEIQKSNSSSVIERNTNMTLNLSDFAQKRDRTHTISVMSPANRKPRYDLRQPNARNKEAPKSGINPSFIFLQLYHSAQFGHTSERPLLVTSHDAVQRAVKILDLIPPYETHKIGVIYVREGQANNEAEILSNRYGSLRYTEFLQNLGTLVKLADIQPQFFFLGGLDENGEDGKYVYIWQDDIIHVTFHVATMMPNKDNDPSCNNKKKHIGNNYVTIVYNESGEEFNINTIRAQFNFACVVIEPLDHHTNRVTVKVKKELEDLTGIGEAKIVSDQNVAILAKQLALHANLASSVAASSKFSNDPYASNWLERLRKIKNVRNKIQDQTKDDNAIYSPDDLQRRKQMEDFTDYT